MVEAQGITKDFLPPLPLSRMAMLDFRRPAPVRALDDVSFSLPAASALAVLGPNGAGKTTLLKILSSLILPDKGTVRVNGLDPASDEERAKANVGLCASSERSFYWRLTGWQNLEFFAAMYGLSGAGARQRIDELLRFFRIDYQDKRFDSYSAGMQQRFGLVRALLHDPALLLLDEPTKSLDYAARQELRELVRMLVTKQGKTVVVTTHSMEEARELADRFLILDKGRLRAFGSLDELRRDAGLPSAALGEIFMRLTGED